MADNSVAAVEDPLRDLLEEQGIRRVAIVDDAFDPIDVQGLTSKERESLWATIEFDDDVRDEFARLRLVVNTFYDISDELIARLLKDPSLCPAFIARWANSDAAQRMNAGLSGVKPLASHLRGTLNLEVREFESTVEPDQLIEYEPQLLFLDWHLGDYASSTEVESNAGPVLPTAVQAANDKALKVLQDWPDEKPKPLIVLMSSRPSMPQDADDFCRRSKILRGMFHAVPKSALGDSFSIRIHLHLFAMSLPEGRRIQSFMDALRRKFSTVRNKFLDEVSDLSLSDYSYIQSLTLKNDGQPLGDYLQQLFSSYLGQLLFAESLGDEWADLDVVTFGKALPSLGLPSDRLTTVYHTALFDTSVGPIRSHPLAVETTTPASNDLPVLAVGDVLRRKSAIGCASHNKKATEREQPLVDGAKIVQESDLLLVINAQCDLAIRPNSPIRPADAERSILLLPGYLQPLDTDPTQFNAFTELYQHDGESYRIRWDTKKVLTIPHGLFAEWKDKMNCERVARLRLPFALEIQRAFAAGLTRVGTPVSPPIFQPVEARLLHASESTYATTSALRDGEAVFRVLTRTGQQCVLTIPLLMRLKALLDVELAAMRTQCTQIQAAGDDPGHLKKQIDALERAIKNESKWATLQSPFDLPTSNSPKKFFDDRIQVLRGIKEGDPCAGKIVVAVCLDLDEVFAQ